jgi:hypothetical protein
MVMHPHNVIDLPKTIDAGSDKVDKPGEISSDMSSASIPF